MWYQIWCVILIAATTMAAIMIPLELVLDHPKQDTLSLSNTFITIVFVLDFFIHLYHSKFQGGRFVGPKRQPDYFLGWLVLDFVAAVPWNLITGINPLELLRLVKVLRVAQLVRQRRTTQMQYLTIFRLSRFLYWLALTAHGLACGWLALGAPTVETNGSSSYLQALYWCVTTLTTVGYGDVTPKTDAQMIYTMFVMVLGVGVYGYVIGNVANMLSHVDLAKANYLSNMERISSFMRYRKIPVPLQRRVYDYYTYLWENRLGYDESAMLSELPPSLQTQVSLVLKREFIEKVPFLKGANQELIRDIALELRPAVFTPGDYIFRAGEIGRHIYFISHGAIEVLSADGTTIYSTLKDGDFFGEIALLSSQPRTASIRAIDYCDLYTLNKETFDHVLARYPDFAKQIQDTASQRQEATELLNRRSEESE